MLSTIFLTIFGLYVLAKLIRGIVFAQRLDNFSRRFHYPRGNNFFGVFTEFIAAARESKINNSISEKLIEWRMKHTKASDAKCWVMKITPFHQILSVGCPKMANFLLNLDPTLTRKGGFSEYLLSSDASFRSGLVLMESEQWKRTRSLFRLALH